jgi:LysM repeat protein
LKLYISKEVAVSRKVITQVSVLVLFILALLGAPFSVQAGGVCGGTWTVEKGETLESIAAMCGTSTSAITAANPGVKVPLAVGQALTIPGGSSTNPGNPPPSTAVPPTSSTVTNNYYTTNNYYNSAPVTSPSYNGTYVVQYGDTFSGIASRYGISVGALWAANPSIQNINVIYVGQVIYIPGASTGNPGTVPAPAPAPTAEPVHLTAGTAPKGTENGQVKLVNRAEADVYVSLQGTMSDGSTVINEYPVNGTVTVGVPAGWYVYVVWVGGVKFTGQFKLGPGLEKSLTFYKNKVVVQ